MDISEFWQDLRRRRVFQVAAIYAAAAWVIVQVAGEFAPALFLPDWVMTALVVGVIIGFPIAVILAWLFDVGRNGVVRTKPGSVTGILSIIVSVGLLAGGTAAFVALVVPEQEGERDLIFSPVANSIAVLPFVDMSADKSYEHFTDGISEVLIHQLSQLAELHVIARTSSFAFKDQNRDMRDIGRTLRVGRLLEGSVQRSDGRLRIAAQLIDTETGTHIWSKLFDRDEEDLFEIQDEISISVANAMEIELSDEAKGRLSNGLTDDLDAMEIYLVGRNELMMTESDGGATKPLEYFKRALVLDPNFALAWSGLSDSYLLHGIGNKIPMQEAIELAREATDKALDLDPLCAEAHASRIFIAAMTNDLVMGRAAFQRSSTLSPSYWPQYLWFGNMLQMNNFLPESSDIFAIGMALQPYKPYHLLKNAYANSLIGLGDYDRGMRTAVELMNDTRGTNLEEQYTTFLGRAAYYEYQFADAIAYAEIATLRGFDSVQLRVERAEAYLALGDYEEADRQLRIAEEWLPKLENSSGPSAGQWVSYTRGVYEILMQDTESSLKRLSTMILEVDQISSDAAWMAGSWANYPSMLSLFHRRFDDVARLESMVIESFPQPGSYTHMVYANQMLGNIEVANEFIEQGKQAFDHWLSQENRVAVDHTVIAEFYLVQGEKVEAIKSLEAAFDEGMYYYLHISLNPIFDNIRTDPEFQNIMRNMKAATQKELEAVREARSTGDWQSLVAEHFANHN